MVAILSTFRELGRLRQIYVVLVRHGFGELANRIGIGPRAKRPANPTSDAPPALPSDPPDPELVAAEEAAAKEGKSPLAARVRLVAMDLGPSFVKLGQIASTRTDILPKEWVVELKKLQDEVAPVPFEQIKEAVESSLGGPLDAFYESFEEAPLAAASIGQVHRAVLKHPDGPKQVVVKVQRPGIRATVQSDLELLHDLARLVERTIPESRTYNPIGLVEQFDRAITAELDFALEADNAIRFARHFEGHEQVRFPVVYKEASSKQVLTLELLPGKKVYDAIAKDGMSGQAIAELTLRIVVKMVFEDGFFHADPHPGNILISGEPDRPVIGIIDLGMVGRLSPEMRDRCIDLMVAVGRNDQIALADALYAMATPTRRVDMRAYRAEVAMLSEKYLGKPLKELEISAMISDLVGGAKKFGLEIPPDFMLVGKALMTIEGVGKEIHPDLDFFEQSKPLFLELLKRRYSPERLGNDLWRGLERLGTTTYDLPQITRELLEDARLGRLQIQANDQGLPTALDRLGRRIFSGFVVAAFVLAGAGLVATGQAIAGWIVLGLGVAVMLGHFARDGIKRWG